MPSGQTHDRITLWTLPWVVGSSLWFTRDGELTLIVAGAFLFSGLMFGPDLDIYSRQFKRWGWLRRFWLPYQKMLRHRSLFSHGLLIGTTLRLLYCLCFLVLLGIPSIAIAQLFIGFPWNWQQVTQNVIRLLCIDYQEEAIALFMGLELGAFSHSFSDWTGSAYKRIQKNGWKGLLPNQPKKRKRRRKTSRRKK